MIDDPDQPQAGRFAGGAHRLPIRVYFEDTDAGGVVYHANYLRFMERARSDMLRLAGVDQRGAINGGDGVYVIRDLAIRYRKPARLDDALLVISHMGELGASSCVIHQRVMRDADLLADAEVTAVLVGPDGRPKRQPRAWTETFERLKES